MDSSDGNSPRLPAREGSPAGAEPPHASHSSDSFTPHSSVLASSSLNSSTSHLSNEEGSSPETGGDADAESRESFSHRTTLPRGRECILVAEDDEMVRNVTATALQMHGYRVLTASDGAEALEMYRQFQGEVALVIVDQSMPKLSGTALVSAIRDLTPDQRMIVTSGLLTFLGTAEAEEAHDDPAFLSKPYQLPELLRLVRIIIDQSVPEEPAE